MVHLLMFQAKNQPFVFLIWTTFGGLLINKVEVNISIHVANVQCIPRIQTFFFLKKRLKSTTILLDTWVDMLYDVFKILGNSCWIGFGVSPVDLIYLGEDFDVLKSSRLFDWVFEDVVGLLYLYVGHEQFVGKRNLAELVYSPNRGIEVHKKTRTRLLGIQYVKSNME